MLIAFFTNEDEDIYNFRKEVIQAQQKQGFDVLVSCPKGRREEELNQMNCLRDYPIIDRRGTNVFADFKLFLHYMKVLKQYKPDVALFYTIKPNVYGGMACSILKIPYIPSITGLGTAIENGGLLSKISLLLYRIGLRNANTLFFHNQAGLNIMKKNRIVKDNGKIIAGSGVNIERYKFEEYPVDNNQLTFVTIGRIMEAKGIRELLQASREIKKEYPSVEFNIVGSYDGNYKSIIEEAQKDGVINYLGYQSDVRPFIKASNAIIHASYHEGMSNVLLEAASMGRPIIATDVPGCREIFDDGISGIAFKPKDSDSLKEAIKKFIELDYEEKKNMGINARKKVKRQFDRNIIIESYLEEIKNIGKINE